MYRCFSSLLALLWLFGHCDSRSIHKHDPAYDTLVKLFSRTIGTTAGLFSVGDGSTPGGCYSQLSTMDVWVSEVQLLHAAVQQAFNNYNNDINLRFMWMAFFGIKTSAGHSAIGTDATTTRNWAAIQSRIASVTQFLDGGGLQDAVTSTSPWVFCQDTWAVDVPWTQPVKNSVGDYVVTVEEPIQYLKLEEAFELSNLVSDSNIAMFVYQLNGYDIFSNDASPLCASRPTRYAVTSHSQTVPTYEGETFSTFDRHILFCPTAFSPGSGKPHSYPSLADAISDANYPAAGAKTPLYSFLTVSATLYHELYHLADPQQTTKDWAYDLASILNLIEGDLTIAVTVNNPETYVFFAMAVYMYLNPPEDTPAVFWPGGLPYAPL